MGMILVTQSAYLGHGHAADSLGDSEFRPHVHLGSAGHHHHAERGHVHSQPDPESAENCQGPTWRFSANHEDDAVYVAANVVLRPCDAPAVKVADPVLLFIFVAEYEVASDHVVSRLEQNRPPPLGQQVPIYMQQCAWLI